jgi:hypothetical protein
MSKMFPFLLLLCTVMFAASAVQTGWMFYAVDGRGAVGHDLSPNRTAAQKFALSYCGNTRCNVIETVSSRCVALAETYHNG